ncbi:MAG TPA: response regulator, partial [Terrimesophilobacter sp.]|nr:response regulator [Terrimesophilobacter sp.]
MTEQYRIIVVEDDADVAEYTKTVLERKLDAIVRTFPDATQVPGAVRDFKPDLLITDIEMPGISGLDLIDLVRRESPGIPVLVITAHASVDYAVTALRNKANDFMAKPVDSGQLVQRVSELAASFRSAQNSTLEKAVVLAIGAHPNDVEVGVGGILAAHRDAGNPVTILVLSRGSIDGGVREAWNQSLASANIIGATVVLEDADEYGIQTDKAVSVIRRTVDEVGPTIVYSHSLNDRHKDHRAVFDATMLATASVPTVVCYQGTTSTTDFNPNRFVTIDGRTDAKLAMLENFAPGGNRPPYLKPDFVLSTARYW